MIKPPLNTDIMRQTILGFVFMTDTAELFKPNFASLPDSFCLTIDYFSAISLSGEEQTKYLQGQVTCDVNTSENDSLLVGAHCDAKGKVLSVFRLINRENKHFLIQPETTISESLAALKKFGVFAKVEIEQALDLSFAAFVGDRAQSSIKALFGACPDSLTPVIQVNSTTIVYIAGSIPKYLLVDSSESITNWIEQSELQQVHDTVWSLLEICDGFPVLSETMINQYAPQVFNVQALGGISFTKGCYLGQETVARMQYLGKNKRAMFALESQQCISNIDTGYVIEKQLGENWRKAGEIVNFYLADDNKATVQAILATDITSGDKLRLKNVENSELTLRALPYLLSESES